MSLLFGLNFIPFCSSAAALTGLLSREPRTIHGQLTLANCIFNLISGVLGNWSLRSLWAFQWYIGLGSRPPGSGFRGVQKSRKNFWPFLDPPKIRSRRSGPKSNISLESPQAPLGHPLIRSSGCPSYLFTISYLADARSRLDFGNLPKYHIENINQGSCRINSSLLPVISLGTTSVQHQCLTFRFPSERKIPR